MKLTKLSSHDRYKYQNLNLLEKIKLAKRIINQSFNQFDVENTTIAWTGGKDSTVLLWLIRQLIKEKKLHLPKALFIDEGDVFVEIRLFINRLVKQWRLDLSITHNQDVFSKAKQIGEMIQVNQLNQRNQQELKRLGFKGKEFPYLPESFIGNHLMKTVATNLWLEKNKTEALFVGVRWDEQEARSKDDFLRKISRPFHFRIQPILHFTESDIWATIHNYKIPYVSLYQQGYRSLGAKTTTHKSSRLPAWKQDLINTQERAGRQQDKEKIMKQLRALGYM